MNANVLIIPGSEQIPERRKPKLLPTRIHFDPPNMERVFVIYWRGAKRGFFDATVEDIDKENRLLHKFRVRHGSVGGWLQPFPADTPLSKKWLDEHSEQVEILTYLGAKILDDLQYTLRW